MGLLSITCGGDRNTDDPDAGTEDCSGPDCTTDPVITGEITFIHSPALGTQALFTDADGEVIQRQSSTPFGVRTAVETKDDADAKAFYFTDKEQDAATGYVYFGARYYDPAIGRWLSADPLVVWGGGGLVDANVYAYVGNAAVVGVDPLGLQDQSENSLLDESPQTMTQRIIDFHVTRYQATGELPSAQEIMARHDVLSEVLSVYERSVSENCEYSGWVGLNPATGDAAVFDLEQGDQNASDPNYTMDNAPAGYLPIVSFHTHPRDNGAHVSRPDEDVAYRDMSVPRMIVQNGVDSGVNDVLIVFYSSRGTGSSQNLLQLQQRISVYNAHAPDWLYASVPTALRVGTDGVADLQRPTREEYTNTLYRLSDLMTAMDAAFSTVFPDQQ